MPSLKELLVAAGVEVSDSVDVSKIIEESDEVKGLAQAKKELHDWKLENKPILDTLQSESEANRKAAEDAIKEKMEAAKKANDLTAYLDAEKELREKAENALASTREGVRNATQDKVIGELAGWFNDPLSGKAFARDLAETTLNEAGEAVTSYKLNGEQYSDAAAFKEALAKSDYGSHMKAGEPSKGPQFGQNKPGGGEPKPKLSPRTSAYLSAMNER